MSTIFGSELKAATVLRLDMASPANFVPEACAASRSPENPFMSSFCQNATPINDLRMTKEGGELEEEVQMN